MGLLEWMKVQNPDIRIVAIGAYLLTTVDCATLYNRYGSHEACKRDEFVTYHNPAERLGSEVPQVHTLDYLYISKYRLLCGGDALAGCTTFANGEPVFHDGHHLSLGAARLLEDRISEVHAKALEAIGLPLPGKLESDGMGEEWIGRCMSAVVSARLHRRAACKADKFCDTRRSTCC